MVEPSPELLLKLSNTARLIAAGRPDLAPPPGVPSPQLVDVQTFNTLLVNRPWAERIHTAPVPGAPRAASPAARPGGPPVAGAPVYDRVLVLCVDFSDRPQQTDISVIKDRYFSQTSNSGHTFRNFYAENSYGKFIPEGEVHGWYRAPNPSTFYTNNNNGIGGYPNNVQKLYEDVIDLAAADPTINWNAIDANGDGLIDMAMIVHSGGEGAQSGSLSDFWAVTWNITPKRAVGKTFSIFAMSAEYITAPGDSAKPGVDAHEFGHVLGLPDLYATNQNSRGTGVFSLMSGGSWANGGNTPVHMDPFSKRFLGWANIIVNPTGPVTLNQAETSPDHISYSTDDPNEVILVENRQKVSFDQFLPGSGLLIWRVNNTQTDNNNPKCYLVGVVEADGQDSLARNQNAGTASDFFPGTLNVRSIGPDTTPSKLVLCDGRPVNVRLTNISNSGPAMTLNSEFIGGTPPQPATRYRCTSTGCVPDPAGAYETSDICQRFCAPPQPGQRYSCVNNTCVPDPAGIYATPEECQLVCKPAAPTRYRCENGVCVPDPTGAYETLLQCQAACQAPPVAIKYSCINGLCVEDPAGQFGSITECQASCMQPPPSTLRYKCLATCVEDPTGPFNSITECQAICALPPPPTVRYRCMNGICTQDPTGPFTSLAECQASCAVTPTVRYRCFNGFCIQDPTGPFTSLQQCLSFCRFTGFGFLEQGNNQIDKSTEQLINKAQQEQIVCNKLQTNQQNLPVLSINALPYNATLVNQPNPITAKTLNNENFSWQQLIDKRLQELGYINTYGYHDTYEYRRKPIYQFLNSDDIVRMRFGIVGGGQ